MSSICAISLGNDIGLHAAFYRKMYAENSTQLLAKDKKKFERFYRYLPLAEVDTWNLTVS